jgi:hypothetical protein
MNQILFLLKSIIKERTFGRFMRKWGFFELTLFLLSLEIQAVAVQ